MSHATSQTHATATQTTPHRLLYFFVAFVLLMFFGLIYAWSLFVDPLEAEFGWDRSATSVVFTLSIITFCAGMLVAGALEERTSPRTVMLITAACLGLGLSLRPSPNRCPSFTPPTACWWEPAWALAPTWSCPSR
mgnify:CR=1 FL=1